MRRSVLLVALVAMLTLAGCGDDDVETGDVGADPSATEPADDTEPDDDTSSGESVSVADAVELDDGTEVTVRGYVFQPDEGATVMCDVLGESFPPICVGPTLTTDGLDINSLPGVETTAPGDLVAPATWTSGAVEVSGTLEAGRLVVS